MVALLKMPRPEQLSDPAERRMFERKATSGEAIGRRIDHTINARQNPRLMMELRDLSIGGLSAVADMPVREGEHVAVSIPRRGLIPGWDAFGRVIRCQPSALGYSVAIEFDSLPAA